MKKVKYVDYRITRNAEDSDLRDDDFAFIFNSKGDIRCVQLSGAADDDETLPYAVDKLIEVIADLELIAKLERTYH